ncbi:PEP-CTERM sorting domain-containing protein [Verrucomicrobiaceae bacterium N1E253]|uniref:PEP-CTERM sorting domain-containing protein n=1 Tax=Oceaniferula marina TaxID=2748318 RepID=A0A851GNJ2_9BACT|nr:PEP-CTERM sorting domain-containing protein [Oceaniferula marina]NWK55704.1 PEP-CTERM sorting domain-containing protein [Oceaniferula marina]
MNSKYHLLKSGAFAGAALAYSAVSATAASTVTGQLVNVDFDGTGGIGAAPTPRTFDGDLANGPATADSINWVDGTAGNDTWNGTVDATSGSLNSLLDSTGGTTSVNVSWSGFNFTYNNYGNNRLGNTKTNGPNGDGFFTSNNNTSIGSVTISGLTVGGLYNLTVIGAGDATDVDVNGTTLSMETWNSTSNPSQFVTFNNVTATGGEITYTVFGPNSDATGGFQINVVPEPSSISLLGLGVLGFALRRKR